MIALAVLTAILLPVISITDDLHAFQFPAEIKRSALQGDQQLTPAVPPNSPPFALALHAFCLNLLDPRGITFLPVEQPLQPQARGYLRSLWSRPPPAATT